MLFACVSSARAESAVWRVDASTQCLYGMPDATPPSGSVPANWPVFAIALTGFVDASQTRMTRMSDGHVVPLAFSPPSSSGFSYSPRELLVAGETYVVEHPLCGTMPRHTTTYDVIAPVTAPSTLGTLEARGLFAANWRQGACHRQYYIALTLHPDSAFDAEPWSAFAWAVSVDSTSGSDLGLVSGRETQLRVGCGPEGGGILPGAHRFRAVASPWLPPGPVFFETATLDHTITCADALRVDYHTGVPLTPTEIAYWDTDIDGSCSPSSVLGASMSMDASVRMDAGGAFDGAVHTEPDTQPNCACGVAHARAPIAPLAILLTLIASRCAASRALRRARRAARS